jgi:hypothetical protein
MKGGRPRRRRLAVASAPEATHAAERVASVHRIRCSASSPSVSAAGPG